MTAKDGARVLIAISIFYVCTRLVRISHGHIFALLLTAAWWYRSSLSSMEKDGTETATFQQIDGQIRALGSPKHFYVDTNAVDFFYDYIGWRALNPDNFDRSIEAIDNMLRILLDTEKPLERCVDHYHIAADFGSLALNLFHGFSHVVDDKVLIAKLKRALSRLEGLVTKYLRQMKHNCAAIERGKGRRDVNWSFVHDSDVPHPYDPTETPFNVYGAL